MSSNELTFYTEEDYAAILNVYGKTREDVRRDVEILKEWVKTQPHLPETPPDRLMKSFLVIQKFSIERTKEKLDAYYSVRNFIPELFTHHPLDADMLEAYTVWQQVPLPKMVGLSRVLITRLVVGDMSKLNPELFFAHIFNFNEVRLLEDYCFHDIFVFDLTGSTVAQVFHPSLLAKTQTVVEKVYSTRMKAVHIIHGLDVLVNMLKSVLKEKLRKRVFVHKSYDSLFEHLPREIFPRDVGGEERPFQELVGMQMKLFEKHKERFDLLRNLKSNEKLRVGKPINDDFYGFYGSFKQMDVD